MKRKHQFTLLCIKVRITGVAQRLDRPLETRGRGLQ